MIEAEFYNKAHPKLHMKEVRIKAKNTSQTSSNEFVTNLKDVWFCWYTQEPRIWDSFNSSIKHKKSTAKLVAALMKLFPC